MTERRLTLREQEEISREAISERLRRAMTYSAVRDRYSTTSYDLYKATALAVREWVIDKWFRTQWQTYELDAKRVYYLSLEFLTGRLLHSNILALEAEEEVRDALGSLGIDLGEIRAFEPDPALGNGGLGRLAACITESAATLAIPFFGYGIRYEYGIFQQKIEEGAQVEVPDPWLQRGNPWEIPREEIRVPVKFRGRIEHDSRGGESHFRWVDTEDVIAVPYDMPILGYKSGAVSTLRLWSARATREFDLARFNAGEYVRAVEEKSATENISRVLYPPDDIYVGKELRLKQQYFLVTATLQDVLRRFLKKPGRRWEDFPRKAAIQLNDTHPAIAVPELMRLMIDEYGVQWNRAWELTQKVFAYTNHTVMPEALESWPIDLMQELLPRHFQLIEEIDRRVRGFAAERFPKRKKLPDQVGIVDRGSNVVKMANLAITGSHSVNGVAELHTQIIRDSVFPHFVALYPERFNAKTNGVTPRRWLYKANRRLSSVISSRIGDEWVRDLDQIEKIRSFIDDSSFREEWQEVRVANKKRLLRWLELNHGIRPDGVDASKWMFDIQIKRIHEYKRQLMNILAVLATWLEVRDGRKLSTPRVTIFGGKAAPGYDIAKLIIRLIHSVGSLIDRDPVAREMMRVLYVPDYRVSAAERLFPACDLSEQISTAGKEASGTGNMKAALNGALTIGTLDGANVEILERVGEENIFIFGHDRSEIDRLREGYDPMKYIEASPSLRAALEFLESTELEPAQPGLFRPLVDRLRDRDEFFVCADFDAYREAHQSACDAWLDQERWITMSIINSSSMGYFSSDRTVRDYAREIWEVESLTGLADEQES